MINESVREELKKIVGDDGLYDHEEALVSYSYDAFTFEGMPEVVLFPKSTEEVSFTLNYPYMSDHEREEALNVEAPPKKKRKRGTPKQTTGGGASSLRRGRPYPCRRGPVLP